MQSNNKKMMSLKLPSLRLGERHGYRIEGDQAFIRADIVGLDEAEARGQTLALELWALESAVTNGEFKGSRVAGLLLAGAFSSPVEGRAFAAPPAGQAPCAMALVLADYSNPVPRMLDAATYARAEHFQLPRMQGAGWRHTGDGVEVWADRVFNPRAAESASGVLRLELWWLAEPYRGGAFDGRLLAGLELGALAGQGTRALGLTRVPGVVVPAEPGYPVLMLREWTAGGYLTRDYLPSAGAAQARAGAGRPGQQERTTGQTLAAAVALHPAGERAARGGTQRAAARAPVLPRILPA